MHQDVVQHTAQRVFDAAAAFGCDLDGLADSDPQASWILWILRQNTAPRIGQIGRAGMYDAPVGLHQVAAIRFLLVAHLYHKDLDFHPKERTCHRQRRTPLSSARLGRDLLHPFLLVIVDLSHGGISLMATY